MKYIVSKMDDWDIVARAIVERLTPGTIVTLSGPLGAGKTTLVQALARTLGVKRIPRSPTFSLVRSYRLPTTSSRLKQLVHVDAYRIEKGSDALALGLDEALIVPGAVAVIEWPEQLRSFLKRFHGQKIEVTIDPEERTGVRRIRVT